MAEERHKQPPCHSFQDKASIFCFRWSFFLFVSILLQELRNLNAGLSGIDLRLLGNLKPGQRLGIYRGLYLRHSRSGISPYPAFAVWVSLNIHLRRLIGELRHNIRSLPNDGRIAQSGSDDRNAGFIRHTVIVHGAEYDIRIFSGHILYIAGASLASISVISPEILIITWEAPVMVVSEELTRPV